MDPTAVSRIHEIIRDYFEKARKRKRKVETVEIEIKEILTKLCKIFKEKMERKIEITEILSEYLK